VLGDVKEPNIRAFFYTGTFFPYLAARVPWSTEITLGLMKGMTFDTPPRSCRKELATGVERQ